MNKYTKAALLTAAMCWMVNAPLGKNLTEAILRALCLVIAFFMVVATQKDDK